MHPEEIKALIRMNGTTPSAIAERLGVSRMTVSHVIHGRGVSARIAKQIGQVTGKHVGALWPGKYPVIEFVEKAGLAQIAPAKAETALAKTLPRKPKAALKRAGKAVAA
ncbi:MAG: transcriptional regulator [Ramlibacter sp.]